MPAARSARRTGRARPAASRRARGPSRRSATAGGFAGAGRATRRRRHCRIGRTLFLSMPEERCRSRKREIRTRCPRPLGFAAVISTNQFKNGTHIEIDGTIFKIVEFQHVKPGKGGAFVRTKLRRIDGRLGDRQDLPGGGEVPPGPHRVAQDAVPLRLRRRGGLHGQPRLRADRDPARRRSARRCSGCCPTPRSRSSSSTSGPATCRCRARSR